MICDNSADQLVVFCEATNTAVHCSASAVYSINTATQTNKQTNTHTIQLLFVCLPISTKWQITNPPPIYYKHAYKTTK
jgi:hypothetical protein